MTEKITIRNVTVEDIDHIVEMERNVWHPVGAEPLAKETLKGWIEERSPFFLLAECNSVPCGFYFGRIITMTESTTLEFLDPKKIHRTGMHNHPHDPHGDSVYGITMLSTMKGAGKILYGAVWQLKRSLRMKYSVGISRLPGFHAYKESVYLDGIDIDSVARTYAVESAVLLGIKILRSRLSVHESYTNGSLTIPDRMLAFHAYGTSFGLLGILPGFMTDPASEDYGAVILSEYPHA